MWIEHDVTHLKPERRSGITIGAFDGVHLGHKALIQQAVRGARRQGWQAVVVTFDPLPGQILDPEGYRLLSTLAERIERFERLGVDGLVVLPFDRALMATPAAAFIEMLTRHLALSGLWIGPDFRLGKDREGDIAFLRAVGAREGFTVEVLHDTVEWRGEPVRSSRIREALAAGDLAQANGCLGYPYALTGEIVHGDRRGRDLGFPTANLAAPEERLLPANGVYVCRATLGSETLGAVTNVGTRPTFDDSPPTVEAFLLDFSGDVYGRTMRLEFLERLRPELKFASAAALIKQMRHDEADARAWLQDDQE
jgi:riboflavin kinase / FMN adenylyltransferase